MAGLSGPAEANETKSYTYDALGRVVVVESAGTVNAGELNSICYDRGGNRKQYRSSDVGIAANCVVTGSTVTSSLLADGENSTDAVDWDYLDAFEDGPIEEVSSGSVVDNGSEAAAEPASGAEAGAQDAPDEAGEAAPQTGE